MAVPPLLQEPAPAAGEDDIPLPDVPMQEPGNGDRGWGGQRHEGTGSGLDIEQPVYRTSTGRWFAARSARAARRSLNRSYGFGDA